MNKSDFMILPTRQHDQHVKIDNLLAQINYVGLSSPLQDL